MDFETYVRTHYKIDYPKKKPKKVTIDDLADCWETAHHFGFMSAYPVKKAERPKMKYRQRVGRNKYPIDELRPGECFEVYVPEDKAVNVVRCSILTCIRERKKRLDPDRQFQTRYDRSTRLITVTRII